MASIAWTDQAIEDLDAACEYIARDSERMAQAFASRVYIAVERLATFPESGRVVPEIGRNDIREVIVGSYRVIYRLRQAVVEVLTVHHGAVPVQNGGQFDC